MNGTFACSHCGGDFALHEQYEVDGRCLCPDCCDALTLVCDQCGKRIWMADNEGDDDTPLCETCYSESYHRCGNCGELLYSANVYCLSRSDTPYCYDCYRDRQNAIHEYSYKPEPVFYGTGPCYFGVELEIDEGGNDGTCAEEILAIANAARKNLYIKSDSSLSDGMELVSHPMSLDYHRTEMPWEEVLQKCRSLGYLSHKTDTCGLHIHVNRGSLGDRGACQDDTISRILYFVEHHWAELLRFSRRTEAQLSRWAARYGYKDRPREILDTAKKGSIGRYACVNILNYDTVEFRIFRGTLKWNTLMATLQLVEEICRVASFYCDEELRVLSWSGFVLGIRPERCKLITYLKERRLYVNEPVAAEDDL